MDTGQAKDVVMSERDMDILSVTRRGYVVSWTLCI
jgi:hypothetical protein